MKLFKLFVLLLAIVVLGTQTNILQNIFAPRVAYAVGDLQVDWGVGVTPGDPIFTISNMAPGDTESRAVTVTNNATDPIPVAIKGIPTDDTDNLSTAMNIIIADGPTTLYGEKTVKQFFIDSQNPEGIELLTLASGESKNLTITVTFDDAAGNQFQNDTLVFDIIFGIATDIPQECSAIDLTGKFPIFGTAGNDRLNGTAKNDIIFGFEGNDRIDSGAGNDCVIGAAGNDRIDSGSGDDILLGNEGIDRMDGGSGKDFIAGGTENDTIDAGSGNDTVTGNEGNDTIDAGSGDDIVTGGTGNDFIDADAGNDTVNGNENNDTLIGGAGIDILTGDTGTDSANGQAGKDTCFTETRINCEL